MRTHTHSTLTIIYPDEHCYAFNPIPIEIMGLPEAAKATITIATLTVHAYAWKGRALFDIAPIVQTLFDTKSLSIVDLSQKINNSTTAIPITVSIADANLTFTTLAIWGALQTDLGILLSSDFNHDYATDFLTQKLASATQSVIWFGDLPFSISIPMLTGDKIELNGAALYTSPKNAIVNLSLNKLHSESGLSDGATITLKSGATTKRTYQIHRQAPPKNYLYIRWIDKKGYYNYWSFEKGVDQYDSQQYGAYITTYQRSTDYQNGFNGGDGRQQGKTAKRTITIAAPLTNLSIWNFLLSITQSPIVDLYTDNDYLGAPRFLKIDTPQGTQTRTPAELADFVTTISLPEINNQHL